MNAPAPFCDSSKIIFAATQLQEQCFDASFRGKLVPALVFVSSDFSTFRLFN